MSSLPPIKFPPPKNKKQAGQQNAFRSYINSHGALRPYAQEIYKAAMNYGLDPVYYASLINFESGGNSNARSKANAYGLAQIHIPSWVGKTDPRTGQTITQANITNPVWNLNFGAYLFSRSLAKNGSYDAAYRNGYNPGYKGGGPFHDLPKGYVPTTTAKSPQEAAQRGVETATAKQNLTDPYVTIKNGRLVKTDQKHAIHVFGQPLRRSEFLPTWQNLNDIYQAYTGKPVTLRAVKDIITSGKSRNKVIEILSRGPNFVNSPVWRQNAPGYEAVWKSIYGQNSSPDQGAIKYAIVNNLGSEGFASTIRSRADYESSQEFKSNVASMSTIYTKIYGVPDAAGLNTIKTATRQGQSADEFAAYLRAQPEYQQSGEFKDRALGLANALGFLTGQTPTLNADLSSGTPVGTNPTAPGVPAGVLQ